MRDRHAQFEFITWSSIGIATTEDRRCDTIELCRADDRIGVCAAECCAKHDLMDGSKLMEWGELGGNGERW